MLTLLVFVTARNVDAGTFVVAVLDTLELHSQVLIVVALSGYAVRLHPVHDELGQGDGAAADICKLFPHVHDEDIVNGRGYGILASLGDVVVGGRFLALRAHDADSKLSFLLSLWWDVRGAYAREVTYDVVDVRGGWELAWHAEVVFTPLTLIDGQFYIG